MKKYSKTKEGQDLGFRTPAHYKQGLAPHKQGLAPHKQGLTPLRGTKGQEQKFNPSRFRIQHKG